jgi:MerR family mercuric resistance operon transcriptional regulator
MRIGELARHAGVGVETVRFYQRRGLLAEPPRRPGGRRQYTESHLTDLRFIRRCRGLGFAVGEIVDLLRLRRSPRRSCRTLHERVQEAIYVLDAKRQTLDLRREALTSMLQRCNTPGAMQDCDLLAAFDE